MARRKPEQAKSRPAEELLPVPSEKPFVFISHDTRDADIAEAFGNLLRDASGGMLPSFRSSDKKGNAGIPFGEEWYAAVMSKLAQASDVVALLTPNSVTRPWILYEAGVAKGSRNTKAYGVTIGIPLNKAIGGPFGQFQNLEATEDELTKLVLDLIHRNRDADPRDEAVRNCVRVFLEAIDRISKTPGRFLSTDAPSDESEVSVAKMFEEVKVLVRDLPERFDRQIHALRTSATHVASNATIRALLAKMGREPSSIRQDWPALHLLIVLSIFRDELPWLYDIGLNYYHAMESGAETRIKQAGKSLRSAAEHIIEDPIIRSVIGNERADEIYYILSRAIREVPGVIVATARPKRPWERREGQGVAEE